MISGLTIGDRLAINGYRANLRVNGRDVRLLTSDKVFKALVSEAVSIDPDLPLGSDPREKLSIQALQDEVPDELMGLAAGSQVPALIMGEKVVITKREDNPASPFVKFEAVKQVP